MFRGRRGKVQGSFIVPKIIDPFFINDRNSINRGKLLNITKKIFSKYYQSTDEDKLPDS